MAVPKRKTTPSKRGMRRSANSKVFPVNVIINKTTGEYTLPHHISLDGYYNGKKIIEKKPAQKAQKAN